MQQNISRQKYIIFLAQSIKDWKFWIKLLIGLIQITSIAIFITAGIIEGNKYIIPEHLSYFTTLSNLLCAIFFLYSTIFHHQEGKSKIDNSEVAKIVLTYMMITVIIYNLNEVMAKDAYIFSSWKYMMSFICEHSVVPLFAIAYYLFFYNHENSKNIKEFSQKWIWYMVFGFVFYLSFFSIIGELGRFLKWKQLFGTMDGSGERTTFVYPFMDWYHGVGFFKGVIPWVECIIMLTGIIIAAVIIDYCYTLIILGLKKVNQKEKTVITQKVEINEVKLI